MDRQTYEPCPHCPDGHNQAGKRSYGVWVASDRDADGQPIHLIVATSNGAHVAEEDAIWLRQIIKDWQSNG